jgi:hypothetical protein
MYSSKAFYGGAVKPFSVVEAIFQFSGGYRDVFEWPDKSENIKSINSIFSRLTFSIISSLSIKSQRPLIIGVIQFFLCFLNLNSTLLHQSWISSGTTIASNLSLHKNIKNMEV